LKRSELKASLGRRKEKRHGNSKKVALPTPILLECSVSLSCPQEEKHPADRYCARDLFCIHNPLDDWGFFYVCINVNAIFFDTITIFIIHEGFP